MIDLALITGGLRLATPLTFAAVGGFFSERSGIVNIALEGIMLLGAFTAGAVTYYTGSPWTGLFSACIVCAAYAGIHGYICITLGGDQIISGMGLNILAFGLTPALCDGLFGTTSSTPVVSRTIPLFAPDIATGIPLIGGIFSQVTVLVWAGFIMVAVAAAVMKYTRFGLRLYAAGENPAMLDAAGASVARYRYAGVIISGVLAGAGGAYLSIAHGAQFIRDMTAGRGFIALAALILGNWKPGRALLACLFYGFMDALQIRLQETGGIPVEIIQIIPYAATVIVLMGLLGRPAPPERLGIPYHLHRNSA